ncbi:MAG: hypothetical protein CL946_05350 [Ectothiorhodospiraceae bacterium]|nr:hypothetical protein [Ectothiorhodospiraceae bacterium]
MNSWKYIAPFLILLSVGIFSAAAQTTVARHVLASGAVNASGGNYVVHGTVGQPAIGPVKETQYAAFQGFWYESGNTSVDIERIPEAQAIGFDLTVHPNPAALHATATLHSTTTGTIQLRICDLLGRIYGAWTEEVDAPGVYRISIPLDGFPAGMYLLEASTSGYRTTRQLIKAR